MTQENILYNTQLTRLKGQHILIEGVVMDIVDTETHTQEVSQKAMVPEQVEKILEKIADSSQLNQMSDGELLRALHSLNRAYENASPTEKEYLEKHTEGVKKIREQLEKRGVQLEIKQPDHTTEEALDTQLVEQWVEKMTGEDISFKKGAVREVQEVYDEKGKRTFILPEQVSLEDVLAVARKLGAIGEETDFSKESTKKIRSFARDVKDASILLASYKGMFGDKVIEDLYAFGQNLEQALLDKKTQKPPLSRKEIEELGLHLPIFADNPKEEEIVKQNNKRRFDHLLEEYQNRLLLFLLGKDARNTSGKDSEESFYHKRLQKERKKRGEDISEEDFDKELLSNKERLLKTFARLTRNGIRSNSEKALGKQRTKMGEDTVFEAVSQKAKTERGELRIKALEDKPEILQQVKESLGLQTDEVLISHIYDKAKEISRLNISLPEQMAQINDLVLKAYGLKYLAGKDNYSPVEALVKGEFGCSIQALLMSDVLKEAYGDKLILMSDTTIAGNTEDELSGHIRLVAITRESLLTDDPKAFFVDTFTKLEEDGPVRETAVHAITDEIFAKRAAEAYSLSPQDMHANIQLDTSIDGEMALYEKNHALTNVDIGVESAIWNNMAASLQQKEGQSKHDYVEEKIRMVERALALNPLSAIAWTQLAALNEGDNIRHSAYFQKAQAINPEVQLASANVFTVDAYTPSSPLTTTDPNVLFMTSLIDAALGANTQLDSLDPDQLRDFLSQVTTLQAGTTNPAAQADLRLIATDLQVAHQASRMALMQQSRTQNEFFSPYSTLTPEDKQRIVEDPEEWLEEQFDKVYKQAKPGQMLDSPLLGTLQNYYNDATRAVASKFEDSDPERVKRFNEIFTLRLYAALGRSTLDQRKFEEVGGSIAKMGGIDGVFEAMNLDEGRVGDMYHLLAARLDAERLAQGGPERRLRPEVIYFIQSEVIDEMLKVGVHITNTAGKDYTWDYQKGVGKYADIYEKNLSQIQSADIKQRDLRFVQATFARFVADFTNDNGRPPNAAEQAALGIKAQQNVAMIRTKDDVTRSVRLAYDLLAVTARDAVIAARGNPSPDEFERYRADPTGVSAYNLEAMLIGKFGLLNHEEEEFLKYIKRETAKNELLYKKKLSEKKVNRMSDEELEEIGTAVLKDLYAVPDFYSSGWRIEGVFDALQARTGNKAHNLGLFMQLKLGKAYWDRDNKGENFRRDTWNKIAKYSPDEIVKLFRERCGGGEMTVDRQLVHQKEDEGFARLMKESVFDPDIPFSANTDTYRSEAQYRYDCFRKKYDPIISALRQNHLNEPRYEQVDWQNLTQEDIDLINGYFGNTTEAARLQKAFERMSEFATQGQQTQFSGPSRVINMLMEDTRFLDIYTRTLRIDDMPLSVLQDVKGAMSRHAPVGAVFSSQIGSDALIRSWNDTKNAQDAGPLLIKFLTDGPIGDHGFSEKIKTSEEFAKKVESYNGPDAEAEMNRALMGSLLLNVEQNKLLDYLGITHLPFNQPVSSSQEIFGPAAKSMRRAEIKRMLFELREKMVKAGHHNADEIVEQLEERLGVTTADMIQMQTVALIILLLMASITIAIEAVDLKGMASGK